MSVLKFDIFGQLDLTRRVQLFKLPPAKRRQLLGGMGRELKRQSVRNLRAGHDVEGKPWAPRRRGPGRRLLRRINRQIAPNFLTDDSVEISFKGVVALQQHEGITKVMTAKAIAQESGKRSHYDEPATLKQAKALRAEGFKIRVKGTKKWRTPPLKWVTENFKQKQAGLILQILRDQPRKKSWLTKVPARPFLGATEQQINGFVNKIFDNTINSRA